MFEQFPSTSIYEVVYNSTAAFRTLPCWALLRTVEYLKHRIRLREYFTNKQHQSVCINIKGKISVSICVSFIAMVNLVLLLKRYALKEFFTMIRAFFALKMSLHHISNSQ